MGVGGSSPLISTIKTAWSGCFFVIYPTLYLPIGKCKAFALLRVAPPLTSITSPSASFKRWGAVSEQALRSMRARPFAIAHNEPTHLYHTKKLRLCLGFAYAKRLAWALIFLFFAPNVNAKAFSAAQLSNAWVVQEGINKLFLFLFSPHYACRRQAQSDALPGWHHP